MHLTRTYSIRAVVNLAEKRAIRVEFKDGKNKGIQLPIGFFQNFKGSSGLFPYVWLRFVSRILWKIFNGNFYSVILRPTKKHIQLAIP
jgi:hypothetical protein